MVLIRDRLTRDGVVKVALDQWIIQSTKAWGDN